MASLIATQQIDFGDGDETPLVLTCNKVINIFNRYRDRWNEMEVLVGSQKSDLSGYVYHGNRADEWRLDAVLSKIDKLIRSMSSKTRQASLLRLYTKKMLDSHSISFQKELECLFISFSSPSRY